MLKTVRNKLLIVIYFVLSALVLEMVSFYLLGMRFMPEYFWYNFSIIMFFSIFFLIVPNYTAQFIIASVVLLVQTVLIYVNYSLYIIYGDIFSFDMFFLLKEAMQATSSSFVYTKVILELVFIYIGLFIAGLITLAFCKNLKVNLKQHYSILLAIVLVILGAFSSTIFIYDRVVFNKANLESYEEYVTSDSFLLNTSYLKASSYEKFGTYGYYLNLVVNQLSNTHNKLVELAKSYFDGGNMYDGTTYENNTTVHGVARGNNVIVIMMESLEWFGFSDGTVEDNLSPEVTPNIYNLIFGADANADYTQSNVKNDSLIATNYFAKSKTNISEGFGIMGNYPVAASLTDLTKSKNSESYFGYTMPSVLKREGYKTTYIHSNVGSFYARNSTHNKIGFDKIYCKDNILDDNGDKVYTGKELKWGRWDEEGNFAKNAMKYIVPVSEQDVQAGEYQPFYTFYLNVSSHGSYMEDDNEYDGDAIKYYNLIKYGADDYQDIDGDGRYERVDKEKELTYSKIYRNYLDRFGDSDPHLCEELVYYLCGVKGLDDAIGNITARLRELGIYDETTLLLYSDHFAYYDNMSQRYKGIGLDDPYQKTKLNTLPMIISCPGLKNFNATSPVGSPLFTITDRFCSAYDVVPTLLDLLGIAYNENFYLGTSLFKPCDYSYIDSATGENVDLVVYYANTGGLFCKDIYTYNMEDYVIENENIDQDDVIKKFHSQAVKVLAKLNYINILNKYGLYPKIKASAK